MEIRGAQFNPSRYSNTPVYNIQAVAAATGVPSITLRSWERRYGIPEPKRDAKGYRLYSERDIAITRWLKERVQQGIGISRAINMYRLLEQQEAMPEPPRSFDFEVLRERLLTSIRDLDEEVLNQVVAQALMVASVEEVALRLLQPTLYDVGRLWETGQLSVTSEHFGSNLLRSHLAQLVRISPAPLRSLRVLIGTAPGELHDIGALVVSLFLRRRGFGVVYAGANPEPDSFVADVLRLQPAAVCLSASSPRTAQSLVGVFEALSGRYGGILAFGGRAFNDNPELVEGVPGVFLGADASTATTSLESLLAGSSLASA